MSCNCKKSNQINHILNYSTVKNPYEKKGVKFYLMSVWYMILNVLFRILGALLLIILTPIVLIILVVKRLLNKELVIGFPKWMVRQINKVANNE